MILILLIKGVCLEKLTNAVEEVNRGGLRRVMLKGVWTTGSILNIDILKIGAVELNESMDLQGLDQGRPPQWLSC